MNWPTMSLSEAQVAVLDCEHRTPPAADSGHPYIAIPEIRDGVIHIEESRRITTAHLLDWTRRTKPAIGDIVVTRRARVGDSAPIPVEDAAIGQNLVILRSSGSRVDQTFLRWAVRSPTWWNEVERWRNVGAVFTSLNVKDITRMEVPIPPLHTQRAIAEVLGALDDKIAANARLGDVALQLADAEFQRARSGAERVGMAFDDVATVAGGATPSTKVPEYWDGDVPWATPTDVTALRAPYLDDTQRKITDLGLEKCSSALYPIDSILMTSRATIGAFALAKVPVAVNQGFIVVQAKNRSAQYWLLHEMRHRVNDFLLYANGATFLELSKSKFKAIEVLWPTDNAMFEGFDSHARSLHDRAYASQVESRQLAALRDTLLPHLMSGRITVREAEKRVEGVL